MNNFCFYFWFLYVLLIYFAVVRFSWVIVIRKDTSFYLRQKLPPVWYMVLFQPFRFSWQDYLE